MMKVAISSTQKAEMHPWSGMVMIASNFMPYTRLPMYVADIEPTVCAIM